MILTKYCDWRNLDLAKLSARIGILELDKIKNIVAEHNLKEDNFTEILTNELTNLKRHKKTWLRVRSIWYYKVMVIKWK